MARDIYNTLRWRTLTAAAIERDNRRCVAAWLLGGECNGRLEVHHIEPVKERPDLAYKLSNLVTVCAKHHRQLESLRRAVRMARTRGWRRCRHEHRTRAGREACERRLNADRLDAIPASR